MKHLKQMILSGFFLALGMVLPFLTGQIREIGNMLLPMHIPVLLCGFVCGPKYGLLVGLITPIFRSFLWGMPALPQAIGMAFELAAYGAITGILYQKFATSKLRIYISLFAAMIAGRIVWGIVSIFIYGISGNTFTWQIFIAGAFFNAIPGIILQIILIPILIFSLEKSGFLHTKSGLQ